MVRTDLRLGVVIVFTLAGLEACSSNQALSLIPIDAYSVPELVPEEDLALVEEPVAEQFTSTEGDSTVGGQEKTGLVVQEHLVSTNRSEAPKVSPDASPVPKPKVNQEQAWLSGRSRQGRSIPVYRYGLDSEKPVAILLVGGIHGRFEGNTVELMKALRGVFAGSPPALPVFILENLNPDGFAVPAGPPGTVAMRFSANSVDLNRNFPVDSWEKNITYRSGEVKKGGGGEYPLSEPETRFLVQTIEKLKQRYRQLIVVNFHSYVYLAGQKGTVQPAYHGEAVNPVPDPISLTYASLYARESNQSLIPRWTAYPVPGEFLNWCGENGVTALDVELSNTTSVIRSLNDGSSHLSRNLSGILALIRVNSR